MNQFIIALCIVGSALAGPPPKECLQGPQTGKTPKECCQIPDIIQQSVFEKCMAANPLPAVPESGPPKGCCVSECVMNETKILVNGKLDKDAAVKYVSEQLKGDAEAIKVATAAIDYCESEGNNKKAEFDEFAKQRPATEKSCNMISGYLIGCVSGQVFKNCPKDKFGADPACNEIKSFVDKCGFLYPGKM